MITVKVYVSMESLQMALDACETLGLRYTLRREEDRTKGYPPQTVPTWSLELAGFREEKDA